MKEASTQTFNVAETIARFVVDAKSDTPQDVRQAAARVLLNGLRAILASSTVNMPDIVYTRRNRDGEAYALFSDRKMSPFEAAEYNQVRWTALLLDEIEPISGTHPGGPACTAALALAQQAAINGSSPAGRDLLSAIAAGVELQACMTVAMSPSMREDRGFAALSATAPFGSVASAASISGVSLEVAKHAIGMSAMCGIGTWEMGGTSSACYLTGKATRLGMEAVAAAQAGYRTAAHAIEGQYGSFHAYSENPIEALHEQVGQLGEGWWIRGLIFQPYSGDTYSQAPLAAIRKLREKHRTREVPEVSRIVISTNERSAKGIATKMSRPSSHGDSFALNSDPPARIAIAWLYGIYSFNNEFEDLARDQAVGRLKAKIEFQSDERFPDFGGAEAAITFADGSTEKAQLESFPGWVSNPARDEELSEAFRSEAAGKLHTDQTERILESVWSLDEARTVNDLLEAVGQLNSNTHQNGS